MWIKNTRTYGALPHKHLYFYNAIGGREIGMDLEGVTEESGGGGGECGQNALYKIFKELIKYFIQYDNNITTKDRC